MLDEIKVAGIGIKWVIGGVMILLAVITVSWFLVVAKMTTKAGAKVNEPKATKVELTDPDDIDRVKRDMQNNGWKSNDKKK